MTYSSHRESDECLDSGLVSGRNSMRILPLTMPWTVSFWVEWCTLPLHPQIADRTMHEHGAYRLWKHLEVSRSMLACSRGLNWSLGSEGWGWTFDGSHYLIFDDIADPRPGYFVQWKIGFYHWGIPIKYNPWVDRLFKLAKKVLQRQLRSCQCYSRSLFF